MDFRDNLNQDNWFSSKHSIFCIYAGTKSFECLRFFSRSKWLRPSHLGRLKSYLVFYFFRKLTFKYFLKLFLSWPFYGSIFFSVLFYFVTTVVILLLLFFLCVFFFLLVFMCLFIFELNQIKHSVVRIGYF